MYKLVRKNGKDVCIIANNGLTAIPIADDNTDYQRYLAWVAEGNTPEVIE